MHLPHQFLREKLINQSTAQLATSFMSQCPLPQFSDNLFVFTSKTPKIGIGYVLSVYSNQNNIFIIFCSLPH